MAWGRVTQHRSNTNSPIHVLCVSATAHGMHVCRHVRSSLSNAVDTTKLALWGTSFAGGHVLVVSSEPEFKDNITAVVTQVSMVSHLCHIQHISRA
jgi:hypothetical protein